jgi:hypothetical protein
VDQRARDFTPMLSEDLLAKSASTPGPSRLEGEVKLEGPPEPCGAPAPQPVARRVFISKARQRLVEILGDCAQTGKVPATYDILTLLDAEYPEHGRFCDSYSDLHTFGIDDALDIEAKEVCYLATFGQLGREGACILRKYTQEKILIPLDLLETKAETVKSVEEVRCRKKILDWQAEVEMGHVEEEDVEVVDGGESTDIEEIEGWGEVSYHTQEEV